MKKSIFFFLITILVLTLCSCNKKDVDFSYVENETGITVTSCSLKEIDITVPDEIDGKTVTAIESAAFGTCETLESITLPATVTEIPENCFNGCTNLKTVNAPGVTKVGLGAFEGTPFIKADGFVTVGDGILIEYNGTGSNLSVPDTVKDIGTVFLGKYNAEKHFSSRHGDKH